jgi:hypothetical protein
MRKEKTSLMTILLDVLIEQSNDFFFICIMTLGLISKLSRKFEKLISNTAVLVMTSLCWILHFAICLQVCYIASNHGVYYTWEDCNKQVYRFPGGYQQGYESLEAASAAYNSFVDTGYQQGESLSFYPL